MADRRCRELLSACVPVQRHNPPAAAVATAVAAAAPHHRRSVPVCSVPWSNQAPLSAAGFAQQPQLKPEIKYRPKLKSNITTSSRCLLLHPARKLPLPLHLQKQSRTSNFHTSTTMATDEEYMAFLDKANQPTGTAPSNPTKTASACVPKEGLHPVLEQVDAYYTSESDEPFRPVSFDWENDKSLNITTFMELLSADADVVSLTPKEFDPKGNYEDVLAAVGEAGNGQVYVFKVDFGGTRLEYYVVSISKDGGQVQGLKALSIES